MAYFQLQSILPPSQKPLFGVIGRSFDYEALSIGRNGGTADPKKALRYFFQMYCFKKLSSFFRSVNDW